MSAPLAQEASGNLLLGYDVGPLSLMDDLEHPLPLALVVAVHDGRVLLGWHRWRAHWELPGGMIDPGESAAEAGLRELTEETGVAAPSVAFHGLATFRLAPDDRWEHGAVFRADVEPAPFAPNDEMTQVLWWDPATDLDDLSPVDAWLARAALR